MKVNEYLEILRDFELNTQGFAVNIENEGNALLKLGSVVVTRFRNESDRYDHVVNYFEKNINLIWEDVEIHFSLNKYMIRDVLRS